MAKYIDFQKLKERISIEDVVLYQLELTLTEKDGSYEGDCPLCGEGDEDSRRFKVTPDKGAFHCFNCKEHGNMIDLVATIEETTWPEAARRIADHFKITDCEFKRSTKKKPAGKSADSKPDNSADAEDSEEPPEREDVNALIDDFMDFEQCATVTVMTLGKALRCIKAGTLDQDDVRVVDIRSLSVLSAALTDKRATA